MSTPTAAAADPPALPDALTGLDAAGVAERVERGQVNAVPAQHSRSLWAILHANVFTLFNALLGTVLVVAVAVGPLQDAAFGVVLVVNTGVGIVQEVRAKRTLDRLAVLNAPRAEAVRGGELRELPVDEIVVDDVLELHQGDQVPVDGVILDTHGLELDESLLTGEADALVKHVGDEVLSGSVVVAGTGRIRATRVGSEAYARRLADEARRFKVVSSELRSGINRVLVAVSWTIVPIAVLLAFSQLRSNSATLDAVRGSIAGVTGMVPEGLVLLGNVAFAAAIVRLGRRSALVQELPAVEVLARVDTICLDKTGTLTEGESVFKSLEVMCDDADCALILGALVGADDHPNASLLAISHAFRESHDDPVVGFVPFSSARKWSGTSFATLGTWVLGAPDVLLPHCGDAGRAQARVHELAEQGFRVILLARSPSPLQGEVLPDVLSVAAIVVIEERVRAEAAATIRFFIRQGVHVKVISGDSPVTVSAVARRVGVPDAARAVDARTLPDDIDGLAAALEANAVFGRVTPHQKRAMVAALQSRGHVVAMTGDGVNDVLALKDADIGIAMGSGSAASRAVATMVLLDGSFATLPHAVAEGRRVIANVERVADLFVTKTVYVMLLALAVALAGVAFPFLPRHLTIVATFTIGIPGFFLALAPSARRARTGFLERILRFAVPAGVMAALATFAAYELALHDPDVTIDQARTTATLVLVALGLWILSTLSRPLTPPRLALFATMALAVALAVCVPRARTFFDLSVPGPLSLLRDTSVGIVAIAVGEIAWHHRNRHPHHGAVAHALPDDEDAEDDGSEDGAEVAGEAAPAAAPAGP